MFAYWHFLRMCAQPARWSARMITVFLLMGVLSASWKISESPMVAVTHGSLTPSFHYTPLSSDLLPGTMLSGLSRFF